MRFKKYKLAILSLALLTVSCGKDFLDKEPTNVLTADRLKEVAKVKPELAASLVPGLYSLTFAYGAGGWGGHTDFGQKSFDIASDLMSGDMVLGSKKYNKFVQEYELTGMTKTGARPYMVWTTYYKIIKGANEIIASFEDKIPDTDVGKATFGQAKALRAYSYYNLVNYFQQPYLESQNKPAVIIYGGENSKGGLSTVEEVYSLVISDLETAIESLKGFKRDNKAQINEYVAKGLLVYAYLFTGEYAKAETLSDDIIKNGGFTLMSKEEVIKSGFNSVDIPGWMWAIDLTTDNTASLPTFWGMVDIFTYSYASVGNTFGLDAGLYEEIPDTDVRKTQFADAFEDGQLLPINKFYDSARKYQGDRTWTNDEVYMRVAEFYLAKAEAQARQNKDAEAKATLLSLVEKRDTNADARISSLSGQSLLDEIYFQTRVELWGEGRSLSAAKRFKKTMTRGSNHIDLKGQSYKYNDPRMIFEIPESELNNNPEL